VSRWNDRDIPALGPVTTEAAEAWRKREPELLGV
jgi:branched-chain amino acid aminotransferase